MKDKLSERMELWGVDKWRELATYARQQVRLINAIKALETEIKDLQSIVDTMKYNEG